MLPVAPSDDGIDRALAERGCALVVGTVGRDGSPHAGRGWGLTLTPASPSPVRLLLDAGEFVTQLKAKVDDDGKLEGYLQMDVPLQGLLYKFEQDESGANVIVVGEGAVMYTFEAAE